MLKEALWLLLYSLLFTYLSAEASSTLYFDVYSLDNGMIFQVLVGMHGLLLINFRAGDESICLCYVQPKS